MTIDARGQVRPKAQTAKAKTAKAQTPKAQTANARGVALEALVAVDQEQAYAGLALERALRRSPLQRRDRSLATELVYGVQRRLNTLDWAIGLVASRPLSDMTVWIRADLRLAAYQLLFLDKIPPSAAVNEAVELAKKHGHKGVAGFVNGILRALLRRKDALPYPDPQADPVGYLSLRHSHPEWLVRRWFNRFGFDGAEALCRVDNEAPPLTVRPNTLKTDRAGLVEALTAEGAETEPGRVFPDAVVIKGGPTFEQLQSFQEGLFTVQDEGSMLVGEALRPAAGETVLDACAAPGGKSVHLAELMRNQGRVIAVDPHPHKLEFIRDNARRLGTDIVTPELGDAREMGARLAGEAGAVLVDAPCSGLGVLRRRADARWRKGPEQIAELHQLQVEILDGVAPAVKPGGVLVYSTCTTEPEENQDTVSDFLAQHPEFEMEDLRPYLPPSLAAENSAAQGWVQLLPHVHGTDGFFIARMRRSAGTGDKGRPVEGG